MDEVAKSLGPAFAAGFAVQRTLEILDPLFGKFGDARKEDRLGLHFPRSRNAHSIQRSASR